MISSCYIDNFITSASIGQKDSWRGIAAITKENTCYYYCNMLHKLPFHFRAEKETIRIVFIRSDSLLRES